MEKRLIKGLLSIGLFGFLFSTCFGASINSTDVLSVSYGNWNNTIQYYLNRYINYNSNNSTIYNFPVYSYCRNSNISSSTWSCDSSSLNNYYFYSDNVGTTFNQYTGKVGADWQIISDRWFHTLTSFGYNGTVFNGNITLNPYSTSNNEPDYVALTPGFLLFGNQNSVSSISKRDLYYLNILINTGTSFNPGNGNFSNISVEHYYYFDSDKLYTDCGTYDDTPSGVLRRKVYNNIHTNYSYIGTYTGEDSLQHIFFSSSKGPIQICVGENSDVSYSLMDSGYLQLSYLDYSSFLTGNYSIVLQISGDKIIYNWYNDLKIGISQLTQSPIKKGYLIFNDSIDNAYNGLLAFASSNGFVFDVYGDTESITLRSYSINYSDNTNNGVNHPYTNYTFSFDENSNVPVIIPGGGNGSDLPESFPDPIFDGGVFDANTYLIEESIKCYLTSGEVCNPPFTYENSTNYVNNYDHLERVRNSTDKTGYLTFNNSVDMLSQYCLNVNTIQYSFCSQLYLYEGYPITYYYNNGYFNYIISGSGWNVNLGTLWSGQLGYAYCEGPFCSNFNEGLPQFIRKDTGDYSDYGFSGEYVSLDFFKNYFDNGFFFQCPFSYSGSYFTIGSKLIDRLDQHDPLKPINCMIAGFSYGVKSKFFGDSKLGLSHSGVFLSNTGPNASRFYTFIDIVLSLGYIFLFSKLFKFLKKH